MSLICLKQHGPLDVVTDGDGRLGQTVRHSGRDAVIGGRAAEAGRGAGAMTAGCDGRFEG